MNYQLLWNRILFVLLSTNLCYINLFTETFAQTTFRFEQYSQENGLSQNTCISILQDSKGFIWVGTQDGLNRFDGYNFVTFRNKKNDKRSISNNTISSLVEDRKGNLWVGTSGGLNLFDFTTQSFTQFKHSASDTNSLCNNAVRSILEDKKGNLWIGTFGGGLNLFDPHTRSFKHFRHSATDSNSISNNYIKSISEDKKGNLWVSTVNGLNLFDVSKNIFTRFGDSYTDAKPIKSYSISRILEDKQGNIWMGTLGNGLIQFDPEEQVFTRFIHKESDSTSISSNIIYSLLEDRQGNIWVGTDSGGLNLFDTKKQSFIQFRRSANNSNSLRGNTILSLLEDRQGNIWIGTAGNGLNFFDISTQSFRHSQHLAKKAGPLNNNSIMSILEDSQENLWLGTIENGLSFLDASTQSFTYFEHLKNNSTSLSHNFVISLLEDSRGNIWVGTHRGGLNLFNAQTKSFTHFKHSPIDTFSISNNAVSSLLEDSKGNFWVGTLGGGLNLFDVDKQTFRHFKHSKEDTTTLANNGVRCLLEDSEGNLWVGTGAGLDLFESYNQSFSHFKNSETNQNAISSNLIVSLLEDSRKIIWIGTGNGLNSYDKNTKTFKQFFIEDGLSNNTIYSILEDDSGNLWISTNNGINKFNPETEEFTCYNEKDGLQKDEFNQGASFKGKDGKLYFGGWNGFNTFYPDSIKNNSFVPPIVLTEFLLFNKPVAIGDTSAKSTFLDKSIIYLDEVTLEYNADIFGFEFSALNYRQSKKNQYAYKLEGYDKSWILTDAKNRRATYSNIPSGTYTFHVKGSNDDGEWNEQARSIRINILPPWWVTVWAKLIYGISFFLILFSFIKWRSYKLEKEKSILEEIVKERTIALRNSLGELQNKNEEIVTQNQTLELQAKKLQELDEIKTRFFSNISHEFRNPLTLIIGPVEKLLKEASEELVKQKYNTILTNAQRLLRLVNQLLDFSKVESGKMVLHPSKNNLNVFLKNIAQSFDLLANQKDIEFKYIENRDIDGILVNPIYFYFDANQLEKVFYNLLSNSFKFTSPGGSISLITYLLEDTVEVIVRDSGIGIPSSQLPFIFNRFYQADTSSTREYEGSGIGLSLTKELVELHGGTIKVYSEINKGTEFIITLPYNQKNIFNNKNKSDLIKPNFLNGNNQASLWNSIPQNSLTNRLNEPKKNSVNLGTILIVEDNNDIRNYIASELNMFYKVLQAADGSEGINKAMETIPDLIISDVMMPKKDGYQLAKIIREDTRTSHIPLIMLTAKYSFESKIEGLEIGADDYLTKPFHTQELLLRVKNMLEMRKKLRESFSKNLLIEPSKITVNSIDAVFLEKAGKIVEKHIDDTTFDVKKFCKEMGMSRTNLHLKLKALTNQSTAEYIRLMRLKRAAQLLKQQSANVTEITFEVGFNDVSYFSKCFKKQFGVLPSKFK